MLPSLGKHLSHYFTKSHFLGFSYILAPVKKKKVATFCKPKLLQIRCFFISCEITKMTANAFVSVWLSWFFDCYCGYCDSFECLYYNHFVSEQVSLPRMVVSPLWAYDIIVILQMDFVLPRCYWSINDWTHERQWGPEPVNHRLAGKKASLNRTSLSPRA